MKILLICKEFPHAQVIGGPIIIYNRLKYLSKNHQVSLAAFFKEEESQFIPTVEDFCHDLKLIPLPKKRSPLNVTKDFLFSPVPHYFLRVHNSPLMAKTVADMVKRDAYDFVIAEYSVMGQFIHKNPLLPAVRRICSVHECYYLARLKDFHHHAWGWKKLREAINLKGLKEYELDMYRQADKVLTLTAQGKKELLDLCPDLDIEIVPHGVDINKFAYSEPESAEKSIVFVGNYLHYPNADAILYFYKEMWPQLKSLIPDIKFYVVGQGPPPEIQAMGKEDNIEVTGRVEEVTPYLKKGQVFICPVRLGGGFRGKILEAMAIGRPIVSTALGAEGIPAAHKENIIIADEGKSFAQGIADLLQDQNSYDKIRENARRLVEETYAWEKGVAVLEKTLEKMMEKPAVRQI